ncbi:MAG: hypothetical protein ABUL53_02450 [Bradyrhizobium guangdongense]
MDPHISQWKLEIERCLSAPEPDFRKMAQIVADISGASHDEPLRLAALQVLPSLRHAAAKSAGRGTREIARQRLGIVQHALHVLSAPRFGKRSHDQPIRHH